MLHFCALVLFTQHQVGGGDTDKICVHTVIVGCTSGGGVCIVLCWSKKKHKT